MTDRRGFTLFELLVAMTLCAALAAAALVGYRRMLAGWQLNAATRQVVMDLKLARARAMLGAATHRVRFIVPGRRYRHERRRPSSTYEALGPASTVPSGVEIVSCSGAGSAISFRPRGHAAAFGTIALRNGDGDRRSVVVDIVGRMRVQ